MTVYRSGWHSATYHARCIPESMTLPTTTRTGSVQSEFYLASPQALSFAPNSYGYDSILLDRNGAPVWWYNTPAPSFFPQLTSRTTFTYFRGTAPPIAVGSGRGVWETRTLSGNLVSTIVPTDGPADFHELALTKTGTYYMDGYIPRSPVDMSPWGGPADSSVVDSVIREIRANGSTVWSWRSQDHIPLADMGRWGSEEVANVALGGSYDVAHVNSIHPDGDGIIASFRHEDAIYRIKHNAAGDIDWKLGGAHTSRSLRIIGDPLAPNTFGGQHDARRLPDGTVSVFDNGTDLGRPPRVTRWKIDTKKRTATLIQSFGDSRVAVSPCCGSARRLPGGHWIVSWGGVPIATETDSSGRRVLTFDYGHTGEFDNFAYRVLPISPGTVSAAALRAAMNVMHPRP